jgi:hypothetical protein
MMEKPDINPKAEVFLNSINNIHRASPGPYFFTRLKAGLEKERPGAWKGSPSIFARPVFIIVALCLVLLVNGLFILQQKQEPAPSQIADQSEQSLANEYGLAINGIDYDYESNEP